MSHRNIVDLLVLKIYAWTNNTVDPHAETYRRMAAESIANEVIAPMVRRVARDVAYSFPATDAARDEFAQRAIDSALAEPDEGGGCDLCGGEGTIETDGPAPDETHGYYCPRCEPHKAAAQFLMTRACRIQRLHEPVSAVHELRDAERVMREWAEKYARAPAAKGVALIAAERRRQVEKEGWTHEHDDEHVEGEMAGAAASYAAAAQRDIAEGPLLAGHQRPPLQTWRWAAKWWKPKDPISNLVRAGALIAAEIDRLTRAALGRKGA